MYIDIVPRFPFPKKTPRRGKGLELWNESVFVVLILPKFLPLENEGDCSSELLKYKKMKIPDAIKEAARDLRKNMTPAEKKLWEYIRRDISGFRFLRQKPLYVFTEDLGQDRFIIPDFYCYEKKLVLEIDGNIHDICDVYNLDREKEKLLSAQGIEVMRITNKEILTDIEKVMQKIITKLS